MTIQYDGTKYSGWQKVSNSKSPTIQDKMEETFSKYFGEKVTIHSSGRTDKGVHALGQVINCQVSKPQDLGMIKNQLNAYLPEDISIIQVDHVDDRFHARLNAKEKTYRYHLWIGDNKPVFNRKYVTLYEGPKLNVGLMGRAMEDLLGTHDFAGFSSDKTKKNTVRTIKRGQIVETEDELIFEFTGDGFLYNMVRIMVGTLIEIGKDELDIGIISQIFQDKKRDMAGKTVYPNGLFLVSVAY